MRIIKVKELLNLRIIEMNDKIMRIIIEYRCFVSAYNRRVYDIKKKVIF